MIIDGCKGEDYELRRVLVKARVVVGPISVIWTSVHRVIVSSILQMVLEMKTSGASAQ